MAAKLTRSEVTPSGQCCERDRNYRSEVRGDCRKLGREHALLAKGGRGL